MQRKTICADPGHCESTAAIPVQPTPNEPYNVCRLTTGGVKKTDQVISTQLILTDEQMKQLAGHPSPDYSLLCRLGKIQIGNKVAAEGEQKFIYFKVAPHLFAEVYPDEPAKSYGITYGTLMACFVFVLVENLLKYNADQLGGVPQSSIDLLIGCPSTSDWTSRKAKDAYASLLQKATRVHSVRIIPESRAAMFSSIENQRNRISAMHGALVFDFGSSTADCTYMLLGRQLIEFSWTLGAAKIEEQMMFYAYQQACQNKGLFQATPASMLETVNELRVAKEAYYSGTYGSKGHPMFASFENAANGQIVDFPLRIDRDYMDTIVRRTPISIKCDSKASATGSWKELCMKFFLEARRRVDNATYTLIENGQKRGIPCPVKDIVLTGGACQMDFVEEICRSVFPDANIYKEDNPSYTVSNGLAWVAVSDDNFAACMEAARKKVDADPACKIDILKANISDALFNQICSIVKARAKEWADRPEEELSTRVLVDDLDAYVKSPKGTAELEATCQKEIICWKDMLSITVEQAVNEQVKKLYSEQVARNLVIPDDVWKQLQAGALSINQLALGRAVTDIDLSDLNLSKQVTQAVIWCAAFALAAVTLGFSVIVGWVVEKMVNFCMKDTNLNKPRNRSKRTAIANMVGRGVDEKKTEILKEFEKSLDQLTQPFSDTVDETLSVAFEIVTLKRFDL